MQFYTVSKLGHMTRSVKNVSKMSIIIYILMSNVVIKNVEIKL